MIAYLRAQISDLRSRIWGARSFALLAVVGIGVSTQPFSCFPRMKSTPSIKPYQQRMPNQPAGQQPFAQGELYPAAKGQFVPTVAPRPKTAAEAVKLGGIYYQYYCHQCHGPTGLGEGTVGRSYVPVPGALNTPRVRAMSDAQLTNAMLHGVGHDPVLAATVPPDRRPLLVQWVRSLPPGPPQPVSPTASQVPARSPVPAPAPVVPLPQRPGTATGR